jgi:hypothetical protein
METAVTQTKNEHIQYTVSNLKNSTTGSTYLGPEVLTAVVMKSSISWDIMACGPLKVSGSFEGTCRSHLQSSVGIATSYGLEGRGFKVRVPVGARFFYSPQLPDRFWGPPSLLSNGHRGLFPLG